MLKPRADASITKKPIRYGKSHIKMRILIIVFKLLFIYKPTFFTLLYLILFIKEIKIILSLQVIKKRFKICCYKFNKMLKFY